MALVYGPETDNVNGQAKCLWSFCSAAIPTVCQVSLSLRAREDLQLPGVLGNMPAVPQKPRQICSDEAVAAGEATDYNKCCCNSVAYSLRQACWVRAFILTYRAPRA